MTALAKGIAHVSFPGGGIFLPARTPYDREALVEYIAHTVHANGRVQVLVDDQRWLVRGTRNRAAGNCAGCSRALSTACNSATDADASDYCVGCAFAPKDQSPRPEYARNRLVG
jgi:hypothetical protein